MQINLSSQKGSVRYIKRVRAVRVIKIHKIFFRNPVKLYISKANDYYLVQTLSSHGWMLQESQLSQYMLKSPQKHFLGYHWLTKKSMSYQTSCLFCATVPAAQNLGASFPLPFCTFEKIYILKPLQGFRLAMDEMTVEAHCFGFSPQLDFATFGSVCVQHTFCKTSK